MPSNFRSILLIRLRYISRFTRQLECGTNNYHRFGRQIFKTRNRSCITWPEPETEFHLIWFELNFVWFDLILMFYAWLVHYTYNKDRCYRQNFSLENFQLKLIEKVGRKRLWWRVWYGSSAEVAFTLRSSVNKQWYKSH